jgi:hypothetical protein
MTFTIVQTKTTPLAEFRDGYLSISGKSVPFNYPEIYDTIRDRLTLYMEKPEKHTTIDFRLSAINAASKRSIINTFCLFEEMKSKGCDVHVNWFYQSDDEDIFELGEIFQSVFDLDIHLRQQD